MDKILLLASVVNNELKNTDLTEDQRKDAIASAIRGYAVDALNRYSFLRDKNIEDNTLKDLVQLEGLDFNLKTRKFF